MNEWEKIQSYHANLKYILKVNWVIINLNKYLLLLLKNMNQADVILVYSWVNINNLELKAK